MLSIAGGLSVVDVCAGPSPAGDLLEGTAYRAVRKIGEGGMGEVLEAEHRALGHRVVVKVIREELAGRPEMRDRMRVEAQALARIRHPSLVMVTDAGHTRSRRPFVVMERLFGRSLREELYSRKVLPVGEAAEIGRQVLLGLCAAHGAGLVHRDIKPDNIFLCQSDDGRPCVKVLDFGVVKIVQAGRDPRTPEPLAAPTGENVTLGTPRYFSPEQARGARDLDARSDLYSVGLVLYGMVAGRGPFDQYRRLSELFHAHAVEAPLPPSAVAPQPVPEVLDRIVARALAKPREERFPDAQSFADALARLLESLGTEGHRFNASVFIPASERDTLETEGRAGGEDPTETSGLYSTRPDGPVMIDHLVKRVLGSAGGPGPSPGGDRPSWPGPAARPSQPGGERASQPGEERASQSGGERVSQSGGERVSQPGPVQVQTVRLVPGPAARPSSPGPVQRDMQVPAARPPWPSGTEPMMAVVAPAQSPVGAAQSPVDAGRAARSGVPETVPMFEVTGPVRASSPGGLPPWMSQQTRAPSAVAPAPTVPVAPARPPVVALVAPPALRSAPPLAGAAWKVPVVALVAVLLVLLGGMLGYLLR
jgi:eukaryotic-like serine/threonine-protein kinase